MEGSSTYIPVVTVQTIVTDHCWFNQHPILIALAANSIFFQLWLYFTIQSHDSIFTDYKRQPLCWFQLGSRQLRTAIAAPLNCWHGNLPVMWYPYPLIIGYVAISIAMVGIIHCRYVFYCCLHSEDVATNLQYCNWVGQSISLQLIAGPWPSLFQMCWGNSTCSTDSKHQDSLWTTYCLVDFPMFLWGALVVLKTVELSTDNLVLLCRYIATENDVM